MRCFASRITCGGRVRWRASTMYRATRPVISADEAARSEPFWAKGPVIALLVEGNAAAVTNPPATCSMRRLVRLEASVFLVMTRRLSLTGVALLGSSLQQGPQRPKIAGGLHRP